MSDASVHSLKTHHIFITAALSVLILCVVSGRQIVNYFHTKSTDLSAVASTTPSNSVFSNTESDDIPLRFQNDAFDVSTTTPENAGLARAITEYVATAQNGGNTAASGAHIASSIASSSRAMVAYTPFTEKDIIVDRDISYERMLTYRADLRASLEPLLSNTQPELDMYARFVTTHDTMYLTQLSHAADNYREAVALTRKVSAPADAASYHLGVLNALQEFTITLDAMVDHANDPFASAAALRNYNEAEQHVYTAFNALASYYVHKK